MIFYILIFIFLLFVLFSLKKGGSFLNDEKIIDHYTIVDDARKRFYVDWKSDKQIKQILKFGNKNAKGRLIELLFKLRVNFNEEELLKDIYKKSDWQIYEKYMINKEKNVQNNSYRAKNHATLLYDFIKTFSKKEKPEILEIGCGDGLISEELKKLLEAKNVYCLEVQNFKNNNIKYIKDLSKFKKNSFDYIIASLSLHHVKDIEELIEKCYFLLKKEGFLILKEHDCWDEFDAMLVDIEHIIYSAREHSSRNEIMKSDYSVPFLYKNYYGWDKLLNKFKWVAANPFHKLTDKLILSPTLIHFMAYKKKE